MIVERRTYTVKPSCEQAAADFVKEAFAVFGFPNVRRIYRSISGPNDVVYQEFEFKDWQEREQFWAGFFAMPQMPEWVEKWGELIESGGSTEFLRMVE
jgi:hypothetical protein